MSDLFIRYGNFLFKYRNHLFPVVLVLLLVLFQPVPFPDQTADWHMDIVGILLAVAGQCLRAAVIGLAYIKRGGVNKKIHADTLVTGGLFSHCRNPLYIGNLLILAGILIIINNPWVYLLGGGFFLVSYSAIVRAEEQYLAGKFGRDYARYCSRVGRWTITLRGLGKTWHSMEFSWRRVIYKDYTTLLTWIITVILVMGLEQTRFFGLGHSIHYLKLSVIAVVITLLGAAGVRRVKKSRPRPSA